MEVPQHLFFVPALNTFHSGAKVKANARKRFDNLNHTKPKLPGLLGVFNRSKVTEKKKSKVSPEVRPVPVLPRREPRPSMVKKCTANGVIDGSIPVVIASVKKAPRTPLATKVTVSPTVLRQTATPPPESKPSSVSPRQPIAKAQVLPEAAVRKPKTSPAAGSPLHTAGKVKTSTERKDGSSSRSPVSSRRTKVVHQLPTPPPTPPLEAPVPKANSKSSTGKATNIPRSKTMVFPKPTPIPRSKLMVFKPESKMAPKPIGTKVEIPKKVKVARVHKEGRSASVSPLAPKPLSKVVQSTEAGKSIIGPGRIPRTPITSSKAALVKPAMPKNNALTNVVARTTTSHAEGREIIKTTTPIAIKSNEMTAEVKIVVSDVQQLEGKSTHQAEVEATAVVDASKTSKEPESETAPDLVNTSGTEERSSPEKEELEQPGKEKEASMTCNYVGDSEPTEAVIPIEASHRQAVAQLKVTLESRKRINAIDGLSTQQLFPKQQEPQVATIPTLAGRTVNNAGSGIQARIAAMYASAGVKAEAQPTVIPAGARVCQFKRPDLLETDKVSRNTRIQREVEALRNMNKVGTAGAAIVKTRAFGGMETANAGAEEPQVKALPLHLRRVVERIRQERSESPLTQN